MNWLKGFATDSPIAFGSVTTVLLWVCYIVAGVAASLLGTTAEGQQIASALVSSLLFGAAHLLHLVLGRPPLWFSSRS